MSFQVLSVGFLLLALIGFGGFIPETVAKPFVDRDGVEWTRDLHGNPYIIDDGVKWPIAMFISKYSYQKEAEGENKKTKKITNLIQVNERNPVESPKTPNKISIEKAPGNIKGRSFDAQYSNVREKLTGDKAPVRISIGNSPADNQDSDSKSVHVELTGHKAPVHISIGNSPADHQDFDSKPVHKELTANKTPVRLSSRNSHADDQNSASKSVHEKVIGDNAPIRLSSGISPANDQDFDSELTSDKAPIRLASGFSQSRNSMSDIRAAPMQYSNVHYSIPIPKSSPEDAQSAVGSASNINIELKIVPADKLYQDSPNPRLAASEERSASGAIPISANDPQSCEQTSYFCYFYANIKRKIYDFAHSVRQHVEKVYNNI